VKAAVHKKYGPPEVVFLTEIDRPVPNDNEVLIRIHATTVNRTDCGFRSAEYFISRFFSGLFRPNNPILGCEFAGEIETVGSRVKRFKPGDRVFGFNDSKFGGHAEYLAIDEHAALAIIPERISYEVAAASTEGAHYALCNIRAAHVSKESKVLVNGATGAIGSAAVQLIKHIGASVVAVCDTQSLDLVKSLGADEVIDYTQTDFTKLNHLQNQFDFVFDAVGKRTFGQCKPLMKEKAFYISTELGPGGQNPLLALMAPFMGGKKVLFPLPYIRQEDVEFLKDLVAHGKFRPLIDRTYPLDQIVEAYRYVETGQKRGNVIITIGS
jgi:NADPH:quinone reductase-like Zn-dependent oxidoreductase